MFTDKPSEGKNAIPKSTESGMLTSVMTAVRRLSSVSTITSITTTAAMMSVWRPFSSERRMKSSWR